MREGEGKERRGVEGRGGKKVKGISQFTLCHCGRDVTHLKPACRYGGNWKEDKCAKVHIEIREVPVYGRPISKSDKMCRPDDRQHDIRPFLQ